jgi:hypothetical protein
LKARLADVRDEDPLSARAPDAASRSRAAVAVICVLAAAVGALRLHYCAALPVNTGDITRHLYTGLVVWKHGLASAGQPLVSAFPGAHGVAWAGMHYNYPVVTLAWFTMLSAIMPTIFFAKLSLTALEGVNSWLVTRITGSRWLGLLYWTMPASVWWVSHEGQFEPVQAFFTLAAMTAFSAAPLWSGALIALAIQSKVTALFLIPLFVWRSWHRGTWKHWSLGLLLGFVPTLLAQTRYDAVKAGFFSGPSMAYNPYYWNPWNQLSWSWHPEWLIVWVQVATYGALVAILVAACVTRKPIDYLAPFAFLAACKATVQAQFWYLVLLPSFLVPLRDRRRRTIALVAVIALEPVSLVQMVSGPFGFTVGNYHGSTTPFTKLTLPD